MFRRCDRSVLLFPIISLSLVRRAWRGSSTLLTWLEWLFTWVFTTSLRSLSVASWFSCSFSHPGALRTSSCVFFKTSTNSITALKTCVNVFTISPVRPCVATKCRSAGKLPSQTPFSTHDSHFSLGNWFVGLINFKMDEALSSIMLLSLNKASALFKWYVMQSTWITYNAVTAQWPLPWKSWKFYVTSSASFSIISPLSALYLSSWVLSSSFSSGRISTCAPKNANLSDVR